MKGKKTKRQKDKKTERQNDKRDSMAEKQKDRKTGGLIKRDKEGE